MGELTMLCFEICDTELQTLNVLTSLIIEVFKESVF